MIEDTLKQITEAGIEHITVSLNFRTFDGESTKKALDILRKYKWTLLDAVNINLCYEVTAQMVYLQPVNSKTELPSFIQLLEQVDRWKAKDPSGPWENFHIKIQRWDIEKQMVTFSWWDGKDSWEDDLSFEEFEKYFEKCY